ncbi:MAG: hypothetical protein Fur0028_15710 [Bacteroidales bacterium]
MLLNLSNHPLSQWSDEQKQEANKLFGQIVDFPFPYISPQWDLKQVEQLAEATFEQILSQFDTKNLVIHIMGEQVFCYIMIKKIEKSNIKCVASTTERIIEEKDGKNIKYFNFIRFRSYF